jgi:hypothetical protein
MGLRIPLLVLVLLASGCNQQADPRVPTKPVVRDSTEGSQQIAPRTDYHQHLASPAEAGLWNGTRLPEIELPAAVAQALRSRGELVKGQERSGEALYHTTRLCSIHGAPEHDGCVVEPPLPAT